MATFLWKSVTSRGLQEPQNCGNGVKTLCLAKVSPERAKTASKGPRSKPNLLFAPDLHQSRSSSARMPLPWKTDFLVFFKYNFYFVSINSPSQFSSSSPPRSVSVWGQSLLPLQTFRFRKWVSLYNKLYIRSQQIVNLGTNSMTDFQQFRNSLVVWPLPPRVTAQKAAKAHYLPYLWQDKPTHELYLIITQWGFAILAAKGALDHHQAKGKADKKAENELHGPSLKQDQNKANQ